MNAIFVTQYKQHFLEIQQILTPEWAMRKPSNWAIRELFRVYKYGSNGVKQGVNLILVFRV